MSNGMLQPHWGEGAERTDKKSLDQIGAAQQEYLHLQVSDALKLMKLLGKAFKELDIPKEAIEMLGLRPFAVYYDTTFMGVPCECAMLAFEHDIPNKIDKVSRIYLTLKEPGFFKCKEYLDQQLGEWHECGMTPYAVVNGGAVTYFVYYKDGYCYRLSMGSAQHHYDLQISKGEPKGKPNRMATSLNIMPGMVMEGMSMPKGMAMPTGMAMAAPKAADNRPLWTCTFCGYKQNKGKFCTECGRPRE